MTRLFRSLQKKLMILDSPWPDRPGESFFVDSPLSAARILQDVINACSSTGGGLLRDTNHPDDNLKIIISFR